MKMSTETIKMIERNKGRGVANVIVGATEAGKSTLLVGMAKGDAVADLLSERVANGKGSLINTEINITDDEQINDDQLYVYGATRKKTTAEIGDDNKLLGRLLFSGAKACTKVKGTNREVFDNKLKKAFNTELKMPSNDSLAYKISAFSEEEKEEIIDRVSQFPIEEVLSLYEETMTIQKTNNKKGQYARNKFCEILGTVEGLEKHIKDFWEKVTECLNTSVMRLIDELKEMQEIAYVNEKDEGEYEFYVILSNKAEEEKIKEMLLNSESASREYLFSKLALVFRGDDFLFEDSSLDEDTFVVSEYNGKKVRVIRFIDTMGLFHQQGKETEDEYDRILDILSEYHTDKVLFVVSTEVNATTKNGYQAIREFFTKSKGNISVYLIFTKWDVYMQSKVSKNEGQNRFRRQQTIKVNWEEIYEMAKDEQEELIDTFGVSLEDNLNKNKPSIKGAYNYGLNSRNEGLDELLGDQDVTYEQAVLSLISDLAQLDKDYSGKIRIKMPSDQPIYSIALDKSRLTAITALYENLIECKGKKLYASTVAACIRKWKIGVPHYSVVYKNDYGYQNIQTKFVDEMGNYARRISTGAISLKTSQLIKSNEDQLKFSNRVDKIVNDYIGKEFANQVLEDSHKQAFASNEPMAQYQRFSNLLTYTQKNYFKSTKITINELIEQCFQRAVEECIDIVINQDCIVIY